MLQRHRTKGDTLPRHLQPHVIYIFNNAGAKSLLKQMDRPRDGNIHITRHILQPERDCGMLFHILLHPVSEVAFG
ncbi:hypothetical protein D3C80_2057340 [compost metagenome]